MLFRKAIHQLFAVLIDTALQLSPEGGLSLQSAAYLNLLRIKSLVQIQRNNLELTRSNLELAEIRQSVGASNQ